MYTNRKANLIHYLQSELKADVALIMSPIHIFYYTGFLSNPHERFFALLIEAESEKTTLFLPELDVEAAKQVVNVDQLIPISDSEDPYKLLQNTISDEIHSIAVEKSILSLLKYGQMLALYPEATFVDIEPYINNERMRKSVDEITHVKKAIEITEEGLKNTITKFVPGMTELQVKAELEYQLTMLGADGLAFDSIVLSGEKSALPHGSAGHQKINEGDFLLFDLGVQLNGYHSDITRTFVVGKSTAKQKEIYEIVLGANEHAIEEVQTGVSLKEIDLAARNYISEKGYGEYFIHRIGHGLGLETHEPPSIHHKNDDQIQPGLLFTIEPGIYIPQFGGVRIEDNIYVTEQGDVEVLTSYPKNLIEI